MFKNQFQRVSLTMKIPKIIKTYTLLALYFLDEHKWWSTTASDPSKRKSKTLDVEITSYGLLALLKAGRFADGLPYFRWLLTQRNSQGGFEGTQDTVVGLQALATFADKIFSKDNNVQVSVKAPPANETNFNVNTDNSLVLQSEEVSI